MKKWLILVVILGLGLPVNGYGKSEQKIEVKEKAAFTYAFMPFSGSYQAMPQKIQQFIGEFFKQGLQPSGGLISVYFNSPENVKESELKWDVGFPVAKETKVKAPLKTAIYQKKRVLEYLHKGSYQALPEVYEKLKKHLEKNGLTFALPTYEFYLNSPMEVKAEELLTRIEIPVKKK